MQVRFDRKTYRKRVQVETVVSMIKRRLGNHVRARTRWGQVRELALVVLTHNLMILWCSILFYRAGLTPLISPTRSNDRKLSQVYATVRVQFHEVTKKFDYRAKTHLVEFQSAVQPEQSPACRT
jgi:hypothetical protein